MIVRSRKLYVIMIRNVKYSGVIRGMEFLVVC